MTTTPDAPTTDVIEWATDATYTSGPRSGDAVRDAALSAGAAAQGIVAGTSVKADQLNQVLWNHSQWLAYVRDYFAAQTGIFGTGRDTAFLSSFSGGGPEAAALSDAYHTDVTIETGFTHGFPSGGTDEAFAGHRIFATGTVTIDGTLRCNGQGGGTGPAGARAGGGTGYTYASLLGGSAGGNGEGGGSVGPGGSGGALTYGGGGAGGAGGTDGTNAGGAAGTLTVPPEGFLHYPKALGLATYDGQRIGGGAGGGGGGCDNSSSQSGCGGGGGGVIVICAPSIIVSATGVIEANGGAGGNGVDAGGSGGGGGGGGGGLIVLISHVFANAGSITAAAGAGGTGFGTGGVNGSNGTDGRIIQLTI